MKFLSPLPYITQSPRSSANVPMEITPGVPIILAPQQVLAVTSRKRQSSEQRPIQPRKQRYILPKPERTLSSQHEAKQKTVLKGLNTSRKVIRKGQPSTFAGPQGTIVRNRLISPVKQSPVLIPGNIASQKFTLHPEHPLLTTSVCSGQSWSSAKNNVALQVQRQIPQTVLSTPGQQTIVIPSNITPHPNLTAQSFSLAAAATPSVSSTVVQSSSQSQGIHFQRMQTPQGPLAIGHGQQIGLPQLPALQNTALLGPHINTATIPVSGVIHAGQRIISLQPTLNSTSLPLQQVSLPGASFAFHSHKEQGSVQVASVFSSNSSSTQITFQDAIVTETSSTITTKQVPSINLADVMKQCGIVPETTPPSSPVPSLQPDLPMAMTDNMGQLGVIDIAKSLPGASFAFHSHKEQGSVQVASAFSSNSSSTQSTSQDDIVTETSSTITTKQVPSINLADVIKQCGIVPETTPPSSPVPSFQPDLPMAMIENMGQLGVIDIAKQTSLAEVLHSSPQVMTVAQPIQTVPQCKLTLAHDGSFIVKSHLMPTSGIAQGQAQSLEVQTRTYINSSGNSSDFVDSTSQAHSALLARLNAAPAVDVMTSLGLAGSICTPTTVTSTVAATPTISALNPLTAQNINDGVFPITSTWLSQPVTTANSQETMFQESCIPAANSGSATDNFARINHVTSISKVNRFQQQLRYDQNAAINIDYKQPFQSVEDACQRLLPFHVFNSPVDQPEKLNKIDKAFETTSMKCLERIQRMKHKYQMLLLKDDMKSSPTPERIMLEKMFIQEETKALKEDKRLVEEGKT